MKAAAAPRQRRDEARMLVVRRDSRNIAEYAARDLPSILRRGDLLVVNDAAALPAALVTSEGDAEFRLTAPVANGRAPAIAFGAGTWRTRTEDRPAPPPLRRHDRLTFSGGLRAHVDSVEGRQVVLHFDEPAAALPSRLYAAGRPVQYAYLSEPLDLWDVQTVYAGRPWAVEAPSAGLGLTFATLRALASAGVRVARVTHAAGLSSTGEPLLDQALPLPERYEVPEQTGAAIAQTHARGGHVVAVGTSVVRALEAASAPEGRAVRGGEGVTALRIGRSHRLRAVDGLLTGVHDPAESHYELMAAFIDEALQRSVSEEAETRELLTHEFGDLCLLLPG